ncbi:protein-tyrosine-phosphatase [Rhodococcus rhodnii]|uniref:Protein-tyrosine phosphatase n=2 Tax=Rhodococcus rhodnii TaxID=38312 RepID=R7WJF1_9NOCA|nr:tyrosine-protein phosphatase [Rhodococcus rhodnii]EOM75412.1 protein-tyrosine phosphatase [Rhodococcus rhodnii LMG 5362]TXG90554.1 protein-tyrosine-phosphatase [Rhodococcus rhodnii]
MTPRSDPVTAIPNFRDVGGHTVADGVVRTGVLYRSVDLSRATVEDVHALEELGIATIFDLRTESERDAAPDRLPAHSRVVDLDVLRDKKVRDVPAQMQRVLSDPSIARDTLGAGRAYAYFRESYRDFVVLPSAVESYRSFYGDLASGTAPALVHCTTGKDRTGWAAAALLALLGVSRDEVYRDYLLTNELLLPALGSVFERFTSSGGDPELLRAVLGVRSEYLDAAFDAVTTRFGDVETYFAEGLGLGAAGVEALRARFVTDDASENTTSPAATPTRSANQS